MASKKFKVGDKVVCPPHGVGEVSSLAQESVGDYSVDMYEIHVLEKGWTFKVPVTATEGKGIRPVSTKRIVDEVYDVVRQPVKRSSNQTWNRRQREYADKIKSGSIRDMAEIYRELRRRGCQSKGLSSSEQRILDEVEGLLVEEIAVVKSLKAERVKGELAALIPSPSSAAGATAA